MRGMSTGELHLSPSRAMVSIRCAALSKKLGVDSDWENQHCKACGIRSVTLLGQGELAVGPVLSCMVRVSAIECTARVRTSRAKSPADFAIDLSSRNLCKAA